MTIQTQMLQGVRNLLIEADLRPKQGTRFQPTGFPELGPAVFKGPDGDVLLVESAQSMANRLEMVCWDDTTNDLVEELKGLSYVRVLKEDGSFLTSSLIEAHRINSPYILESADDSFKKRLKEDVGVMEKGPVDHHLLATVLARYDVGSLVHGVFLAKSELAGGRLRVARALSSFIEARGISEAASGGVKFDHVDPQGDTKKGFGHVPFSREEFSAESIVAYFNIDLGQIRSYRLGRAMEDLLVAWSLYKIRAFLDSGLRLRTACDLELVGDLRVTRPDGFTVPSLAELRTAMPDYVGACAELFAAPPVTEVTYKPKK